MSAVATPVAPPPAASLALASLVALPGSQEMPRKRWTRAEYQQLVTQGFIPEGAPYELLEGEIVAKVTQNRRHIIASVQLFQVLLGVFGLNRVQSQMPIGIDEANEPEPDAAVLRDVVQSYSDSAPGPSDVLLVVEVADATLRADLNVKSALYGRAGIPEYWVVDVNGRTLTVFRQPAPAGYTDIATLAESDVVSPLAAPNAAIPVADLLPPAV